MGKFYRNISDFLSLENIEVDAGSLWRYEPQQDILVLVDNDQYVTAYMDEKIFNPE